jgi:hypothetical protein
MKSVVAVLVAGVGAFFATVFSDTREMWAPLIVVVVPLLAFMLWPMRDEPVTPPRGGRKKMA